MRLFKIFTTILTVVTLILLPVSSISAHQVPVVYKYLIGVDPLCGLDPAACPDVSRAANGDTLEVTGEGSLSWHPKSISGEGTLVHKNADGDVIGKGVWKAIQLLSLQEYGCGGGGFPDEFCGGKALIRVSIKPEGADKLYTGILQVDCLVGDHVPGGAVEGVRLNVMGGPNFNEEVSGFTILIKQ